MRTSFVGAVGGTCAAIAIGVTLSFLYPITSDGAWYLHMAERVLDGAQLYRDVIDVNPPLIVWVSMPVIILERVTGVHRLDLFPALVSLGGILSVLASYRFSRYALEGEERYVLAGGLAVALLILPLEVWGQREHLMLLLTTPYVIAMCARLRGGDPRGSVATGVAAGLGFVMKPHFLPGLALLLAWEFAVSRRIWRGSKIALATVLLYALIVVTLTPYVSTVGEIAGLYATYGNSSTWRIASDARTVVPAATLLVALLPGHAREIRRVVSALAVIWLALLIVQGKGFPYHYIPAISYGALMIVLGAIASRRPHAGVTAVFALLVVSLFWLEPPADPREAKYSELRAAAAGGPALVLSPYLRDVWPHVTYADVEWHFPLPSAWPLRAADPGPELALAWMLPVLREGMPVLVPLDTTRSALHLFMKFEGFRAVWSEYHEAERGHYYRVFRIRPSTRGETLNR